MMLSILNPLFWNLPRGSCSDFIDVLRDLPELQTPDQLGGIIDSNNGERPIKRFDGFDQFFVFQALIPIAQINNLDLNFVAVFSSQLGCKKLCSLLRRPAGGSATSEAVPQIRLVENSNLDSHVSSFY